MEGRICNFCGEYKLVEDLVKNKGIKCGYSPLCKTCKNIKQRDSRKNNGDIHTKKYEKTRKGYLMRTYRNMLSRVRGVLKSKAHLYEGLEILPKDEFYSWSLNNPNFINLFNDYVNSDYDIKVSPSIDRIDSSRGYTLDNIRWITFLENSRLGAISPRRKEKHERTDY